jgi:hypothetical protein
MKNLLRNLRQSKHFAFLLFFLLALVPFFVYFLRPDFLANDTYGFLTLICQNNNAVGASGVPLMLFSLLPCNILALKVLLFACCVVSGFFIIKLATLFSPQNGWRASYLLFLSSITILEFAKLEEESFAYPFLFASAYFLFKGLKTGKRLYYIIAFGLLAPAFLLWKGAVFYLIGYGLNIGFILIALVPLILINFEGNKLYWEGLLGQVVRTWVVKEDLPFKFHAHFLLTFGLFGAVLEPLLMPQALFYTALGLASAKFWPLSLPFLAVGLVLLPEKVKELRLVEELPKSAQRLLGHFDLNTTLLVVSLFCVAGLAQSVWLGPPTQDNWDAIDYALSLDVNANNDWGMGYWVRWRGGVTDSFQSPAKQNEFLKGQVVISEEILTCPILRKFGRINVFGC